MRSFRRSTDDCCMTTSCAATRPSTSSDRRTDRQVHAELERRLEAHLLIARRIRPAR